MGKITWGIVGAGRIAASFAKALASSGESSCYAVASRSIERGRKFARKWNFPKVYTDYESLFANSDVDAVYIATPHMNHAELSIAAMKAGKSVLCEKPAAVNAKELQAVHECAQETGCFFMEALWTKFNPVFLKVLEWIKSGRIGSLQAVYSDFCFSQGNEPVYADSGATNRLYDRNLAGGALLDVGIYPVTVALASIEAGGEEKQPEEKLMPALVSNVARMTGTGVDAFDSISLMFEKAVAHLSCGIDVECGDLLKEARFVGENGTITVPLFWMPQKAELREKNGKIIEVFEKPFEVNGYEYEITEFCRCLKERLAGNKIIESPLHTHRQSLRVIQVLDMLREKIALVYPCESVNPSKTETSGNEVLVYTDGACSGNPGPGGWACVLLADGMQYTASGGEERTTNNRMELSAAIAALSAVIQNESWKNRSVVLHIDSQYVKNGISSWIKGWKKNGWRNSEKQAVKNRDLWEVLDSLNTQLNVEWKWVKGHSGVEYNEICDKLATSEVAKFTR